MRSLSSDHGSRYAFGIDALKGAIRDVERVHPVDSHSSSRVHRATSIAPVNFMINLPEFSAVRARVMRTLLPSTKLGRTTLRLGGLSVLLIALRWITGSASGAKLSGWATFVNVVFALCAFLLTFRWARPHLLWRLRNRLSVTYIFVGVIPFLLLLVMAGVGGYLFAGRFATYIAISKLQSELQHLEAANILDSFGACPMVRLATSGNDRVHGMLQ